MKNKTLEDHPSLERDVLSKIVSETLEEVDSSERKLQQESVAASIISGVDLADLFEKNARSFAFAASAFSETERTQVEHIYAFCRITDDLVDLDEGASKEELNARLNAWLNLAKNAYHGNLSGIEWLDTLMQQSARNQVPFKLINDLVEGIRSDIDLTQIETLFELDCYCYRVASVVGLWMCHMFGIREAWTLERASALGRAMQVTNILRDVGEDLRNGRVYLPATLLEKYGLTRSDLLGMLHGAPISEAYRLMIRDLIAKAEADYEFAWEGIAALPEGFGKAVAVAAHVYRGIHRGIISNRYNNFTKRAYTSYFHKFVYGIKARLRLHSARRRFINSRAVIEVEKDEVCFSPVSPG